MAEFKEALSSLSPISYDELPGEDAYLQFMQDAFAHAELVINTLPPPSSPSQSSAATFTPAPPNSAKNATETYCDPSQLSIPYYETDSAAAKAWGKPLKLGAKENPLGVSVFKMAAHDRHGAWFARRSIHQGIGFEKWKTAAQHEFLESLKVQGGPGSGAVRGVAADRRIQKHKPSEESSIEVWQTSSAFPGPVTPRESLTLIFSSTNALSQKPQATSEEPSPGSDLAIPRHFLVISRPTKHADAPNRPNLVKMQYESVEMIREIPLANVDDPESNPVEWLMVTRSDPGGGIPKFMVERGTPASIVADVSKFLNWACSRSKDSFDNVQESEIDEGVAAQNAKADAAEHKVIEHGEGGQTSTTALASHVGGEAQQQTGQDGLVSKLTDTVGTTMSGYLPVFQSQSGIRATEDDLDTSSDTSELSDGTFRSAYDEQAWTPGEEHSTNEKNDSNVSLGGGTSLDGGSKHHAQGSREIEKLVQQRASLDARAAKERDTFQHKAAQASEKEEKERGKMLERHEKQRKKQEERYHRELAKLDARRIKEEKKEEERRKKAEAKDEVKRLKSEVAEWKEKSHMAEKEAGLLRQQVEKLQRENTAIVAKLPEGEAKSILSQSGKSRTSTSSLADSAKSAAS